MYNKQQFKQYFKLKEKAEDSRPFHSEKYKGMTILTKTKC